jgi:hypothetical protein
MALQQELSTSQSETEHAVCFFNERASNLPGVVRVDHHAALTIAELSFTAYVRTGDLSARNSVYDLESEIYVRYPGARLDIHVREDG